MGQPLKPITKVRKPKRVGYLTSDIEAFSWTNFLCIGMYDIEKDFYYDFTNLTEYFSYITNYCYKNKIKTVFFQFGGIYDFMFLLGHLWDSGDLPYTVGDIIPRGSGLLSFNLYCGELFTPNGAPFKITFRDSAALLPFGLDSMAKAFNVPTQKIQIDYEQFEEMWKTKEGKLKILDYLEHDCIAHAECIKVFYEWELVEKSGRAHTTAGQALKIFRTFMDKEIQPLSDKLDDFCRKSYMGGRTEVFRPIFCSDYNIKENKKNLSKRQLKFLKQNAEEKDLKYYDVNGLYPYVMKENEYPIQTKGFDPCGESYDGKTLGIWRATVQVPKDMFCPPLAIKHKIGLTEKLVYPTGTITGHWTTHELEYAKSIGVKIIKIHEGATFYSGGKIFKEFIEFLYTKRLKAKKAGDSVNDLLCKLIMNALYGKFGINKHDKEKIELEGGFANEREYATITSPSGKKYNLCLVPSDMSRSFSNVAIASYVTSYARIHMHKNVYMKCGPETIYYTDTDSVFTAVKMKTGNALGEVKLEYKCTSACFLLPKTYCNEGIIGEDFIKKITMKGFDKKKVQHFNFEDFFESLRGDLDRLKIIQKPKFAKFKSAVTSGTMLGMTFKERTPKEQEILRRRDEVREANYLKKYGIQKQFVKDQYQFSERKISSQYDKRVIIDEGFSTTAINLGE